MRQRVGLSFFSPDLSRHIWAQVLFSGSINASLYMQSQAMTKSTPFRPLSAPCLKWEGNEETESNSQSNSKVSILDSGTSIGCLCLLLDFLGFFLVVVCIFSDMLCFRSFIE